MAPWIVVGVDTSVAWPTTDTDIEFRGHKLTLRPGSKELMPSVAFWHPAVLSFDEALLIVRHFLSSLAWVERTAVREEGVMGGTRPIRIGWPMRGNVITHNFRHDYLPDPADPRSRLALAIYREALGLNSVAYRFLGFFKVINLLRKTSREQKDWINAALPSVKEHGAVERWTELAETVPDVGAYLYESGRCAVAHSYSELVADPENVADCARLSKDLYLIQALAELAIESALGVKSQDAVWREHLYHLEGFRNLLGEDIASRIRQKDAGIDLSALRVPTLSLRVRDRDQLASFCGLTATAKVAVEGVLWIECLSRSDVLHVLIGLDLSNELLLFDPEQGIAVHRDSGADSLQGMMDHLQLLKELLCNGALEILVSETGECLGRTDTYIGHNIDLAGSLENIDRTFEQLRTRLAEVTGPADPPN